MSISIPEAEQEKILVKSLKKIKEQTYFINSAVDKNNLRQCLRESYILLSELRTNYLTPRKYYHLYISAFDVMLSIKNFMAEEIGRGRRLIDLYDSVQQAKHVIPRLYLMITAGTIYMEKVPRSVHVILFDMLGIVKKAQNPIKGLFVRNYLLKLTKDKLPDRDNVYVREGGTFEDTLKFLLQNMEEMNRLWIRLLVGVSEQEKIERQKEREELKILVGESISRLSSLESLTLDIYEQQILPKMLKIIIDSKDSLSQQYLMECIIHCFPNSYNIKCMEMILETMTKLVDGVDISVLFMSLMAKIGKYFGDNLNDQNSNYNNTELREILISARNVYPVLLNNFEIIINANINNENKENNVENDKEKDKDDNKEDKNKKHNISNISLIKLLELINSFMNFSINCSPLEQKFDAINKILASTVEIVRKFKMIYDASKKVLNDDEKKKIYEILLSPLEGCINVFEIEPYKKLIDILDIEQKKSLGIEIINILVNNVGNPKIAQLDSIENLQKIIKCIQPLLTDGKDITDEQNDLISIEKEQNIVCKLLFIINSTNPEVICEIYNQFKNIFSYGGANRRRFTLPTLVNAIIIFCHKVTSCYGYHKKKLPDSMDLVILNEILKTIDVTKISSDEAFVKLMLNIHKLLNEAIGLIIEEKPELAFRLYICAASQVNEILVEREKFADTISSYVYKALAIIQEGRYNENIKVDLLVALASNLINYSSLADKTKEEIIDEILKISEDMPRREDQFKVMITISQLYYSIFKDGKKVLDGLNKARRFADFAMTNPKNLSLFVELLNKYLYFVELGDNVVDVKKEKVEDIIELIKGHISSIQSVPGEEDISYLEEIEKYLNNTLNIIKKRKNDGNNEKLKEFYQSINV